MTGSDIRDFFSGILYDLMHLGSADILSLVFRLVITFFAVVLVYAALKFAFGVLREIFGWLFIPVHFISDAIKNRLWISKTRRKAYWHKRREEKRRKEEEKQQKIREREEAERERKKQEELDKVLDALKIKPSDSEKEK